MLSGSQTIRGNCCSKVLLDSSLIVDKECCKEKMSGLAWEGTKYTPGTLTYLGQLQGLILSQILEMTCRCVIHYPCFCNQNCVVHKKWLLG